MPLTNHTTDLQLSLALKEAGWPQEESLFYWTNFLQDFDGEFCYKTDLNSVKELRYLTYCSFISKDDFIEGCQIVATPTASELMERMPSSVEGRAMFVDRFHDKWLVGYPDFYDDDKPFMDSVPNALAKLALFLVKEGMMKF